MDATKHLSTAKEHVSTGYPTSTTLVLYLYKYSAFIMQVVFSDISTFFLLSL